MTSSTEPVDPTALADARQRGQVEGRIEGRRQCIAALQAANTDGWPGGRGSEVEGCRQAAISVLQQLTAPVAVHMRLRWRQDGGHVYVMVWVGAGPDLTHGRAGQLVLTPEQWETMQTQLSDGVEVVHQDTPLTGLIRLPTLDVTMGEGERP